LWLAACGLWLAACGLWLAACGLRFAIAKALKNPYSKEVIYHEFRKTVELRDLQQIQGDLYALYQM